MNETKSTVKTALSFVLVLTLIVATLFGVNVPYEMDEVISTETPEATEPNEIVKVENEQETEAPKTEVPTDEPIVGEPTDEKPTETPVVDEVPGKEPVDDNVVEVPVEDDYNAENEGVTNDVPQDSTPTDAETGDVDNSVDTEVAEPTEDENYATEGDAENA